MLNQQATTSFKAINKSEAIENPISIDLIEPHLYLGLYMKIQNFFVYFSILQKFKLTVFRKCYSCYVTCNLE